MYKKNCPEGQSRGGSLVNSDQVGCNLAAVFELEKLSMNLNPVFLMLIMNSALFSIVRAINEAMASDKEGKR